MSQEELKEVLENNIKIVEYYGIKNQIPVWIEEMSELTKVLCKWFRRYDELEGDITVQLLYDMKEEITDVMACLDQLKHLILYTEDDLIKNYKFKVDRQLGRIEKEKMMKK